MSQTRLPPQRRALSRILKQPLVDLPLLTSFQSEDIKRLRKQVSSYISSLKDEDRLFTQLKVPIKKKYLERLETDHELHSNMFLFLLRYLNSMQNLSETQKIYIIALEVTDFSDPLALKYEFMPGLENIYEKISDLAIFNLLAYVIRVDSRWIIEVINLKAQKAWLVDFINPALSHLKSNVLHFLIDRVHFEFFKDHLPEKFDFLEKFIVRDLSDYGIYAGFMVYRLITNESNQIDDIKNVFEDFDESTMKSFEEKILWLIYSIIAKNMKETNKEQPLKSVIINKHSSSNFDNRKSISIRKVDSLPVKENDGVGFSSKLIKDLLKKTKDEILNEVSSKKNNTNVDKFIDEELERKTIHFPKLDDHHLRLSKQDLKELLGKYKEKFETIRQQQLNEEQDKSMRYMQNYSSFNYLLWYYYNYDQTTYKKLLEEYNKRLQSHLLTNLGLPPLIPEETIETFEEFPNYTLPKESVESAKSKKLYIPQYNVSVKDNNDSLFDQSKDRTQTNMSKDDYNNNKQNSINVIKGRLHRKGVSENMNMVKTEPDESLEKYQNFKHNDIQGQPALKYIKTPYLPIRKASIDQNGQVKMPSNINNTVSHRKSKSYLNNNNIIGLSNAYLLPQEDIKNNKSNIILSKNNSSINNIVSYNYLKTPMLPPEKKTTAPPIVSYNYLKSPLLSEKKKAATPYLNHEYYNTDHPTNKEIKLPIIRVKSPNGHSRRPTLEKK